MYNHMGETEEACQGKNGSEKKQLIENNYTQVKTGLVCTM